MRLHILQENTYVTADGKSLAKKDAKHKILLGAAGHGIPEHQAIELGLLDVDGAVKKVKDELDAKHKKPEATKEKKPEATK